MPNPISCGEYVVQVVGRGGSPLRYELAFTSISLSRPINNSATCRVSIPNEAASGTTCCEAFRNAEPWRDELLLWRDGELAFAGPLVTITASRSGGQFSANDLFFWMDQRFIETRLHSDGDAAVVFNDIFTAAYEVDPSPNIDIEYKRTGEQTVQDFEADQFHRAADSLRTLAKYGVDFVMDGRKLLVGNLDDFLPSAPLILHDDGVSDAEVSREGSSFATDIAVFASPERAGDAPITGRAIRALDRYGLVQKSFTDLLVKDNTSANAEALARLQAVHPAPLRVKVTFSSGAGFGYRDLMPGRKFDSRLSEVAGCIEIAEVMRLQQVDVAVNVSDSGMSEQVTGQLVPVGGEF